jgi:type IX secretion system PorP/SprF family membrane protein
MQKLPGIAFMLLFATSSLLAQDPVFSQFFAAPIYLNPAFTGVSITPKISLMYRNQWQGLDDAYQTYGASFDQSVEDYNSGMGFIAMMDREGGGIYQTARFSGLYGYKLNFDNNWTIKFGVEAGFFQKMIDWDRLVFTDQLSPISGAVDPSGNPVLSEEIQPEDLRRSGLDISAGLLVYNNKFYAGLSAKHLNSPNQSFLSVNDNLNIGLPYLISFQAGSEITLDGRNNTTSRAFVSPNLLVIAQGPFGQVNAGAYFGLGQFFAGAWYRVGFENPDAAIFLAGFREGVLRMGYSFDFTLSRLSTWSPGGTHEISIAINFDDSRLQKRKRKAANLNDCFQMFK